ncbi:WG repeat-containing protein [Paenibacillus donghaensis]|uniref:DUF3298 domain-containing protein n=1 Tax=Paenibacillus donghaensis TaxID=414771 RepID=A0A2Z2KR41_9BACL|nr:WG repeat-containing protein [Paenibacillus donghaensis]ASA22841.1 hypothetical protein B9T62_19770 [Paenibacillus donghaensis]
MLRIRLNELVKADDSCQVQAEVWKWDGIGWNEFITQQEEDFIRAEEELFVTIPAEPGLYRVDYSSRPLEQLFGLPEAGEQGLLRSSILHPAPFKLKDGTLWGYINDEGKVVLEPRYDYAEDFQENGQAIVLLGNNNGLIDSSGREKVKPIYSFIAPFSEGRAVVSDARGYTLIDEQGKPVTSARYDYLNSLQDGRALFSKQSTTSPSRYGYLNRQGKEVLPPVYEDAGDFKDGVALVKIRSGEYALIDPDGRKLHTYKHPYVGNPGEGMLAYQAVENGKSGYLRTDGSVAIEPQFTAALPFMEGRAVINTAEDYGNAYGLIDKQGERIIPAQYYEVQQLGENRVALGTPLYPDQPYRGSRYVIADAQTGGVLSSHPLLGVNNYKDGLASVYDAKETYFINTSGNRAAQPPVIAGSGTLSRSGNLIRADVDQRTAYYDLRGRQVWRQNGVILLRPPYSVVEHKFKPNNDYLVYYPVVEGIADNEVARKVNHRLRKVSLAEGAGSGAQEFSYSGDFAVSFFRKQLLVLELTGYRFPYGAAHGMPTRIYEHINLRKGRFFELKDLFKPGSKYVEKLSEIVGKQIEKDPQYSYVFPDTYMGIRADQPFFVDEDALNLYFEPYEIAPYVAGFPTFRIPYAEIMGLISTEGEFWQSFH